MVVLQSFWFERFGAWLNHSFWGAHPALHCWQCKVLPVLRDQNGHTMDEELCCCPGVLTHRTANGVENIVSREASASLNFLSLAHSFCLGGCVAGMRSCVCGGRVVPASSNGVLHLRPGFKISSETSLFWRCPK